MVTLLAFSTLIPQLEELMSKDYFIQEQQLRIAYESKQPAVQSINERDGLLPPVPLHLRNASTKLMKDLGKRKTISLQLIRYKLLLKFIVGYGAGYKYTHKAEDDAKQSYLPEEMKKVNFFQTNCQ